MHRIKLTFFVAALLAGTAGFCQEEILSRKVESMEEAQKDGPNSTYFSHFYLDFGLMADVTESDVSRLRATSAVAGVGWRNKLRLTRRLSLVGDLNYHRLGYKLKPSFFMLQYSGSNDLDRQRIVQHTFGVDLLARINHGRQGNHLGNFIDLGFWCRGVFLTELRWMKQDTDDWRRENLFHTSDSYRNFSPVQIGAKARLGFNWFSIWVDYRLTPLFESDISDAADGFNNFNLAPLMLGVEVKLF